MVASLNIFVIMLHFRQSEKNIDSDLDQGAGEEANSPAGGARGVGGVSIFTRKFEEGNRSLFLGGSFVQCDDIPLIMAGGKIQSRK